MRMHGCSQCLPYGLHDALPLGIQIREASGKNKPTSLINGDCWWRKSLLYSIVLPVRQYCGL